jgi:spoIIIJ-associated protein
MEWVETTGKTIDEAKEIALDRLGVTDDEAEFEVLDEPKAGLFGRTRGEARVRARVRPAEVRPKQDRRRRSKSAAESAPPNGDAASAESSAPSEPSVAQTPAASTSAPAPAPRAAAPAPRAAAPDQRGDDAEVVAPAAVGAAAVEFMDGLTAAFGVTATSSLEVDGTELEVQVQGDQLGLLIGPGGRTLLAIQDLARVAAQRRLGDHDTRLRIDVAGYRERRREALERFAHTVAEQVLASGTSRRLEPMPSADRKIIHDVLTDIDGVTSRSEGDDPNRRVVVVPG